MAVRVRDLLPPPKSINMGTGSMDIRGLNLTQIVELLQNHKEKILPFFQGKEVNYAEMVSTAPNMVADMIAAAADAKGQEDDIKLFPLMDQVNALSEVWKLSVPDLKKLEESLSGAVATLGRSAGPASLALRNTLQSVSPPSSSEATDSPTSAATP